MNNNMSIISCVGYYTLKRKKGATDFGGSLRRKIQRTRVKACVETQMLIIIVLLYISFLNLRVYQEQKALLTAYQPVMLHIY